MLSSDQVGFDLWALDFYGFSCSDRYPETDVPAESNPPLCLAEDGAAQLAAAVRFILEHQGHTSLSLIAHSWGSMVAGRFAGDHPMLVDRPGSRSKIRYIMSAVFNHAIRHEWTDRNPISKVRTSAKRLREPDVLSPAEFAAILPELELRERVMLVGSTGLRRSELVALTWSDIDLELIQVNVRRSCVRNHFGDTKTEASRRPVPLHPAVVKCLGTWRRRRRHLRANELLRCRERAKLLARLHRRHIEVERQQPPVLVALATRWFGRDLRSRELPVKCSVLVVPRQRRQRLGRLGEILPLAKPQFLRHAVLGDIKIICSQAWNEVPAFVLHHHRVNHQLHVDREHRPFRALGGLIRADFLRQSESSAEAIDEQGAKSSHGQNLSLTVVCKLRIAFGAMGSSN
jgi:pimeloyl-ACP methyl ester carboxylesterase